MDAFPTSPTTLPKHSIRDSRLSIMSLRHMHRMAVALLALISIPTAWSWQIIAHRGVFHDVKDEYCTAENSISAVIRAATMKGVSGVEIDVRAARDGKLLAFHDPVMNALTYKDNDRGLMNPVRVALKQRPQPAPYRLSDHNANELEHTAMKVYGRGARILSNAEEKPFVSSLSDLLLAIKDSHPSLIVMLDVQNSYTADASARLISALGMQKQVYLKFWASLAISPGARYNGAHTCFLYAQAHRWSGIRVIPEINELQLTPRTGFVRAFGTNLRVSEYLDCWANAQRDHSSNGAALMPMVSAMLPNFGNPSATAAAYEALDWAKAHGRQRVSVIVMPDMCTIVVGRGGGRRAWRTKDGITAFLVGRTQVDKRRAFCDARADYCVVDVMADFDKYSVTADYDPYMAGLCPA